jgi:hypothetical protein
MITREAAPGQVVEHAFEHGTDIARTGQRRALGWALGVNTALLVVEVAGGIAFGVFLGLSGAALVTARRSWRAGQHSFGGYSAGTGVGALTTLVLAGAGFGQAPRLVNLAGLLQRISIITSFTWLSALSFRALRRMSSIAAPMD